MIKTRTVQLLQFCSARDRIKTPASFLWLPDGIVFVAQMVTEQSVLDDGVHMKIYDDAFFVEILGLRGKELDVSFTKIRND
ncbi:hypothetical protein IH970_11025 [candidate division KSB1 bacterium]|nr:hypothetical protein [candidate division KSB1 bacterium]